MSPRLLLPLTCLLLAACDPSAIMGPDPKAVQKEADSKAIGGACRYGLRSIEDCYTLNPKAVKSHVFTGWKDMDAYMRENKIDGVASTVKPEGAEDAPAKPAASEAKAEPKAEPKADAKPAAKAKDAHAGH